MRLLELKSLINEAGLQPKDFQNKLGTPEDRVPIFLNKIIF